MLLNDRLELGTPHEEVGREPAIDQMEIDAHGPQPIQIDQQRGPVSVAARLAAPPRVADLQPDGAAGCVQRQAEMDQRKLAALVRRARDLRLLPDDFG